MTIWTFGDSFSRHFKQTKHFPSLSESWIEKLSCLTNHEIVSNSDPLLTLEHAFYNFNNLRSNFKEKDIIIVTITNIDRRWFFKKYPLKTLFLSEDEQFAVEKYTKYFDNLLDIQTIYLTNFLYNLDNLTKKLNLHSIVIPSFYDGEIVINDIKHNFNSINFSNISLGTVSYREFKNGFMLEDYGKDIRVNHLCKDNHLILCNKIINNINNKTPLDFNSDFKQDFLDDELLKNSKFKKNQLFNEIMVRIMRIKINRSP